jgi:hypothetical protein
MSSSQSAAAISRSRCHSSFANFIVVLKPLPCPVAPVAGCSIALADGVFHLNEEQFLTEVAKRFGFTNTEFSYIKARHVNSGSHNPYEVLGVTLEIGNNALKFHYRKLVADIILTR